MKNFPAGREPIAVAMTLDGRTLVVANHIPELRADRLFTYATVRMIDIESGHTDVIGLPNGAMNLRDVCISPDGHYAYTGHVMSNYESVAYLNSSASPIAVRLRVFRFAGAPSSSYKMTALNMPLAPGGARAAEGIFFADGDVSGEHSTYLTLANHSPDQSALIKTIYYFENGQPRLVVSEEVPAMSRQTVNVWKVFSREGIAPQRFGVCVMTDDEAPITAERSVYWNSGGIYRIDGHSSAGAQATATEWFLAEGSTSSGRETLLQILNPNAAYVEVTATFMIEEGVNVSKTYSIPPETRITLNAGDADLAPNKNFSVRVTSNDGSEDGKYLFPYIPVGDYFTVFHMPVDHLPSPKDQASDDLDSDGEGTTLGGQLVAITAVTNIEILEIDLTWDQGIYDRSALPAVWAIAEMGSPRPFRSFNVTERHTVDRDPLRRELDRQRSGEARHSHFCRCRNAMVG